jgi:uncharacterized repeat protein (TIGR01451 family)
VRIRGSWIAVPAFAMAGAVGHTTITSWLAAQEPPATYGYYPPKVSPSQPGLVPAGGVPQTRNTPPQPNRTYGQPTKWNPSPSGKLTTPAVSGASLDPVPIRQVGATEPLTLPPPKITSEPLTMPRVAAEPLGAPPSLTKPLPTPVPLTPPKLTVESNLPDPLPLRTAPPPTTGVPLPAVPKLIAESERSGPPALKPPAPPTLTTSAMPVIPSVPPAVVEPPVGPKVSTSNFPFANLATKSAPTVVLEVIAPDSVSVNQPLTYELVVRNTGAAAVANVRVEDEPPAGAKFVTSEPAAEQVNGRLVWQLGALDAAAEKRIKVTVKPSDEGEVRSRAVVSFSAATEARVKVTRPKINVAVTAVETVRVGDEVAFTIRVSNTGTGAANKMQLQANLTDGLNHAQGGVIETELANLPAGESRTITLRTLATKAGAQACSLVVAADGNPSETSKLAVAVIEPLLAAKVAGPAKCLVRSEPEFKIEFSNPGSAPTDAVQALAAIPDGFEFVSATDGGAVTPGTRTVSWKLNGLAVGGKKEVGLKVRATGIADGTLKVQAQVAADTTTEGGITPAAARVTRPLEAKAEAPIKAEGVPALRFEVLDVEDPVEVGKEAIYEIKVVNQGTAPCTNVQIAAALADGTAATGATGPTQARGQGQTVTFDAVASLDMKQEVVFKVKVKGGVAGDQRFRVQVTCDQIRTVAKEESTRFVKD